MKGLEISGTDNQNNKGLVTDQLSLSFTEGSTRPLRERHFPDLTQQEDRITSQASWVPVWCHFGSSRLPLVNLNLSLESRRKQFSKTFKKKRTKYDVSPHLT